MVYSANQHSKNIVTEDNSENTEVKSYLFIRPQIKQTSLPTLPNEPIHVQTSNNLAIPDASMLKEQAIEPKVKDLTTQTELIKTEPSNTEEVAPEADSLNSKSTILSSKKDLGNQSSSINTSNFAERSITSYFQEHNQFKDNEMSKAAAQEYRQRQTSPIIDSKRTIDTSPTSAINVELVDEKLVANKFKNVNCEAGVNKALVVLLGHTGGAVRCTPKPDIQSFIDKHKK
jgi:hypothetical protein